jgi:uncharacterized protein YdcH (DUF465 family)
MENTPSTGTTATSTDDPNVADIVRVRIPAGLYTEFRDHLVREEADEHAGYLVAGVHRYTERSGRKDNDVLEYLDQDITCLGMDEYAEQGPSYVTLSHRTLRDAAFDSATDDRYLNDRAILVAHSHPFHQNPTYSALDDDSEPMAFTGLTAEGDGPHASLLFGAEDTLTGRVWPADVSKIRDREVAVTDPIDEIIVVIGGGYATEGTEDDAITHLEDRKERIDDRIGELDEAIAELETQGEQLSQEAQKRLQQVQQEQLQGQGGLGGGPQPGE